MYKLLKLVKDIRNESITRNIPDQKRGVDFSRANSFMLHLGAPEYSTDQQVTVLHNISYIEPFLFSLTRLESVCRLNPHSKILELDQAPFDKDNISQVLHFGKNEKVNFRDFYSLKSEFNPSSLFDKSYFTDYCSYRSLVIHDSKVNILDVNLHLLLGDILNGKEAIEMGLLFEARHRVLTCISMWMRLSLSLVIPTEMSDKLYLKTHQNNGFPLVNAEVKENFIKVFSPYIKHRGLLRAMTLETQKNLIKWKNLEENINFKKVG